MRPLALPPGPLNVLCLGAHPDDIEIGCGGTLLALAETRSLTVTWIVFSGSPARAAEARASAARLLGASARVDARVEGFRDGYFPAESAAIKDAFEKLKSGPAPDLVFTHTIEDRHQDHRLLAELTWNTFRDHLVLEYEIPKYDGDLGRPSVYVPLSPAICERKVQHLLEAFPSQREKRWFRRETFLALLHLRGVEAGASEGAAEAFYGRKLVFRDSRP